MAVIMQESRHNNNLLHLFDLVEETIDQQSLVSNYDCFLFEFKYVIQILDGWTGILLKDSSSVQCEMSYVHCQSHFPSLFSL